MNTIVQAVFRSKLIDWRVLCFSLTFNDYELNSIDGYQLSQRCPDESMHFKIVEKFEAFNFGVETRHLLSTGTICTPNYPSNCMFSRLNQYTSNLLKSSNH